MNPIEHGLTDSDQLLSLIRRQPDYVAAFASVFGSDSGTVTLEQVTKAIASFERTLLSGDSPFDRYLYGGDKSALSDSAVRGMEVFRGRAGCANCHPIGPTSALFTDNGFHSLGVGYKRIEPRLAQIAVDVARAQEKSLE